MATCLAGWLCACLTFWLCDQFKTGFCTCLTGWLSGHKAAFVLALLCIQAHWTAHRLGKFQGRNWREYSTSADRCKGFFFYRKLFSCSRLHGLTCQLTTWAATKETSFNHFHWLWFYPWKRHMVLHILIAHLATYSWGSSSFSEAHSVYWKKATRQLWS